MDYKLWSEDQQLYFWAFVLAMAVQHKYLQMEFENQVITIWSQTILANHNNACFCCLVIRLQIVLLRKFEQDKQAQEGDGLLRIDADAIKKEFGDSKFFEGSILPPQDELRT